MNQAARPPPPPEKPEPIECCGSGCVPCIYDYYYTNLEKWELRHGITLAEYLSSQQK